MASDAAPDAAKINQVREKFLKKYNGSILDDTYDERDVEWVKSCDQLICNTLKSQKVGGNVDKAADLLNEVLLFRAKYKLNDLKETDLNKESRDLNGVFFHGKDKQGRPVLHFQVHKQKKGHLTEETRQFITWRINQHYMKSPEQQVIFLFDMAEAGVNNMDLDITKHIITCASTYFPNVTAMNLMFKMNTALEAVWMVIKGWLDPYQSKNTYFVKRKNIQQYIDKDQLPAHMVKDD